MEVGYVSPESFDLEVQPPPDSLPLPGRIRSKHLDGLRGVAAGVVVLWHFYQCFYWQIPIFKDYQIYRVLPFSFALNGHFMVSIFFVLSGRVLVERPYRTRTIDTTQQKLVRIRNGFIQRPVRLILPCLCLLALMWSVTRVFKPQFIYVLFDTYIAPGLPARDEVNHHNLRYASTHSLPSVYEIIDYFMFPTMNRFLYSYGIFWTMPFEVWGSFSIYFLSIWTLQYEIFGLISIISAIGFHLWFPQSLSWNAHFLSGLLLCHIRFGLTESLGSLGDFSKTMRSMFKIVRHGLFYIALTSGVFVWGCQNEALGGIQYIMPQVLLYCSATNLGLFGAIGIVHAVDESPKLQYQLQNSRISFLGEISFGLYLVHGACISAVSTIIVSTLLILFPQHASYGVALLISLVPSYFVAIVAGTLFTRYIDDWSVRVAYWSTRVCMQPNGISQAWQASRVFLVAKCESIGAAVSYAVHNLSDPRKWF